MKIILLFSLLVSSFNLYAQTIIFEGTSEKEISEKEIRSIISVYPVSILKKVEITVKHLEYGVSGKGGFSFIYISPDFSKSVIERTIHHELSTVFLKSYDYLKTFNIIEKQFIELNGDKNYDKKYNENSDTKLTESEKDYYAVKSYAKSTFENDYNMICEELFVNGKEFLQTIKPNTVIYKKTMIVINFYNTLDKKFTLEYFQKN